MLRRRLVTAALSGPVVMVAPNLARAAGNSSFDTAQCLQDISNQSPDPFSSSADGNFEFVRETRTLVLVEFKDENGDTTSTQTLFRVGDQFFETVSPNDEVAVDLNIDNVAQSEEVQALVVVDSNGAAQGVGQLGDGGFPLTNSCLGSIV